MACRGTTAFLERYLENGQLRHLNYAGPGNPLCAEYLRDHPPVQFINGARTHSDEIALRHDMAYDAAKNAPTATERRRLVHEADLRYLAEHEQYPNEPAKQGYYAIRAKVAIEPKLRVGPIRLLGDYAGAGRRKRRGGRELLNLPGIGLLSEARAAANALLPINSLGGKSHRGGELFDLPGIEILTGARRQARSVLDAASPENRGLWALGGCYLPANAVGSLNLPRVGAGHRHKPKQRRVLRAAGGRKAARKGRGGRHVNLGLAPAYQPLY